MLYSKFLFYLNLERSLQCIQVILDANLPFGIAYVILGEGLRLRILLVDRKPVAKSVGVVKPSYHTVILLKLLKAFTPL